MALWLETIKTNTSDEQVAELAKYADELTATIFYHSALNVNLREVQAGNLKAFYANIHNDSGVIIRQERWTLPEPEPIEP